MSDAASHHSDHDLMKEKANAMTATPKPFVAGPRLYGYGLAFFVYFGLATAEMALAAVELHRYGNLITRYPSAEVKHLVGLVLFNGIFSMIVALGSFACPLYVLSFFTFASSVIWAVSAGLLYKVTPFHGMCGGSFAPPFDAFASECKIYSAMMAIGWAVWAWTLILSVAVFVHTFMAAKRHAPLKNMYGA